MPMEAILFDWDGTLADSQVAIFDANAAVMAAFGLPFDRDTYRRHYSPDWQLMYRRLGVPPDRVPEAAAIWLAAFGQAEGVALFPGVRDALVRLAAAGHVLGVVTSGQGEIVRPQIERFGLGGLLSVRVFGDDLPEQKPDPAPLVRALNSGHLRGRAVDATYVGDAPEDMQMAVRASVRAIGVTSGMGEAAALIASGAAEVADSVAAWVDGWLGRSPGVRPKASPAVATGRPATDRSA